MRQAGKVTKTEKFLLGLTAAFLCLLAALYLGDTRADGEAVTVKTERTAAQSELAPEPLAVDLNTAAAEELQQLPGIGPELAERIIAHRTEHGAFESPEDIMNVSGIGPGKFEAFAGMITVEGMETE